MDDLVITASSSVDLDDVRDARLGTRFGRLDLLSQIALVAVESLELNFDDYGRDRIGLCLVATAGSLATDVAYWDGRDGTGGPSPTLFAYTLPSAALGEIAIRHRLTGPNLCFVGNSSTVMAEARDWLRRGTVDACLCVSSTVITPAVAALTGHPPLTRAGALFVTRAGGKR